MDNILLKLEDNIKKCNEYLQKHDSSLIQIALSKKDNIINLKGSYMDRLDSLEIKSDEILNNAFINKYDAAYAAFYLIFNYFIDILNKVGFTFKHAELDKYIKEHPFEEVKVKEEAIKLFDNDYKKALTNIEKNTEIANYILVFINSFAAFTDKKNKMLIDGHIDTLKVLLSRGTRNSIFSDRKDTSKEKKGCFIATSIYGSYDAKEVWMLRRYRDFYLDARPLGRIFIKLYYSISPTIIKLFGNTKWFKKIFKSYLDKKINKLKEMNYLDKKYQDTY